LEGQSVAPALANTAPCEEGEYQLLETILTKDNLKRALKRVEENEGAPGIDGMKTCELREYLMTEWPHIKASLLDGTYQPTPVKRVEIPKPDGGIRLLGIPIVLDRLIEQAIAQILTPIFEKIFSKHSHGFRPGRKAHDAVRNAGRYIEEGYDWVVDIDLEKYFDRVNHDILMSRAARKVKDKRVLKLIRKYLETGVMINGVVIETEEGTPQGGPLSPLLSNIMLDDLDKELEKRGHRFERFADDCNIYVKTQRAGERVYQSIKALLETKLKLKVNEAKSAVDRPWNRKFLGFSFYRIKGKVRIRLAPKTIKRIKARVREITKRNRGISVEAVIERLNKYLRGSLLGYYALADMKGFLTDLEGWIRRKLRVVIWKQWKQTRTRFNELRKLGLSIEITKKIVSSRKGYWRLSETPQLHIVMGKAYFKSLGLVNLVERYSLIRQG
jgi:RNA-directed DNA polymerase